MRRVVRGFWGPRQETAEELAGRWKLLLERIAALLPAAGGYVRTRVERRGRDRAWIPGRTESGSRTAAGARIARSARGCRSSGSGRIGAGHPLVRE
ncbi:hypothetical protein [Streptomyces sp. NPDC057580]|uniref:hypothetical protein n=1 Tax=Streptomyces sp. NPDC057580 TaxID=3346173 RepID=UPI0036B11FAB